MTAPIVPSITDEQLEEIYQHAVDGGQCNDVNTLLIVARLRASEKEAARYRFIRDDCGRRWDLMYEDVEITVPTQDQDDCNDLDALIDAAMEQSK